MQSPPCSDKTLNLEHFRPEEKDCASNRCRSKNYLQILDNLKAFFPAPVSNPVMDSYFVHTVSRFLDRIDDLKSAAPLLGQKRESLYQETQNAVFPEALVRWRKSPRRWWIIAAVCPSGPTPMPRST